MYINALAMSVALLYVQVMPSQLLLKSGEKTTYLAMLQCGPLSAVIVHVLGFV